jgi:hypothetical protein
MHGLLGTLGGLAVLLEPARQLVLLAREALERRAVGQAQLAAALVGWCRN